ncbi:MAG TPA: LysR family transcriptional regulator, partial [Candidatus Dormibacteraeota bacterium]|nr:LysR family transcriptional regulator [Candidatus Dormibacteraeota bacterium]
MKPKVLPMGISLAHLRTLQEVSKRASFSKAARALGISQPAVSQQLALLSRTLGLPLFHRERGRLALTEAGRFVVGRADEMIADADRLVREVRGFAEAQSGRLNFATTRTIGTHLVPRLVAEFLRDRPAVEPHVRIANTHDVAALVADGEVLFGLVEGSIEDERIVT